MPTAHSTNSKQPPVLLLIRDGWGANPHREHDAFNAVKLAQTPIAAALEKTCPSTLIQTSGIDVGLPIGANGPVMGNSEVGHQNIGAGRIVDQELRRISGSIESGTFFENAPLIAAIAHAGATGSKVHLIGLVSDGQVHSDLEHLLALIELARVQFPKNGLSLSQLALHAITDGRDTPPKSGAAHVEQVEDALHNAGFPPIASIMGRFFAMDRDNRWDRVERAYNCLTLPSATCATSAGEAIARHYNSPEDPNCVGDEFIGPIAIGQSPEACQATRLADNDAIIFFNFRGDRPREILKALLFDDAAFAGLPRGGFQRQRQPNDLSVTGLTRYEAGLPIEVAFEKPDKMSMILGETIAHAGLRQFRCAETEKFPHVTFFFNDYRESPFDGETRLLVPSPTDVTTYDQKPAMSAHAVRDGVLARLASESCEEFLIVNFANADMVGHTGSLDAAIKACECVDACCGEVLDALRARGGSAIVCADHGNAEQMWNPIANCPHTAHTNYTVPLHVVGEAFCGATLRSGGRLADIAPTLLAMAMVGQPDAMTGTSLLQ